jgi:hypothetical protein
MMMMECMVLSLSLFAFVFFLLFVLTFLAVVFSHEATLGRAKLFVGEFDLFQPILGIGP